MKKFGPNVRVALLLVLLSPVPSFAQSAPATQRAASQGATTGTVVFAGPATFIVRTESGDFVVFAINRGTARPRPLVIGSRVVVESTPADDADGARTATSVTVSAGGDTGRAGADSAAPRSFDDIPPSVRQLERDVARNARRYGAGIRAGVGLDPELVLVGAHATFGPIFSRRLAFRPNVEFAYGELTTQFSVNLEGIYRLTQTMPRNQWSPYAGGGPALGFSHRGFSTQASDGRSFDFSDLSFKGGLNILAGVEKPSGVFVEMKATVYGDPHLRVLFGVTF